jgi:hypothetical protein
MVDFSGTSSIICQCIEKIINSNKQYSNNDKLNNNYILDEDKKRINKREHDNESYT